MGLTFNELRIANDQRTRLSFPEKKSIDQIMDMLVEHAAQAKVLTVCEKDQEALEQIADVVILADLLTSNMNVDLAKVVVDRFNAFGRRIHCPVELTNHPPINNPTEYRGIEEERRLAGKQPKVY